MPRLSRLSSPWIIIGLCLVTTGCLDRSAQDLRPVVYSNDGRHVTLSLPLYSSWQHCANSAVLYHSGVWEFTGAPAQAQILNWDTGYPRTLPLPTGDRIGSHTFSQSPDCATVAFTDQDWIYLFSVESGSLTKWVAGAYPAYAPDGKSIAFQRDRTLILKQVASGEETALHDLDGLLSGQASYLAGVSWGGTGRYLLLTMEFADREPFGEDFVLVDLDGGNAITVFQTSSGQLLSPPAMSPDERYVAYIDEAASNQDSALIVYGIAQACVVAVHPMVDASKVFWAPDGTQILVMTWPGSEGDFIDVSDVLPANLTPPCLEP